MSRRVIFSSCQTRDRSGELFAVVRLPPRDGVVRLTAFGLLPRREADLDALEAVLRGLGVVEEVVGCAGAGEALAGSAGVADGVSQLLLEEAEGVGSGCVPGAEPVAGLRVAAGFMAAVQRSY